jgi:hypothetical protein
VCSCNAFINEVGTLKLILHWLFVSCLFVHVNLSVCFSAVIIDSFFLFHMMLAFIVSV